LDDSYPLYLDVKIVCGSLDVKCLDREI